MFICKKAEFEFDGVSFALPSGMLLDMASSAADDGFHLTAPDKSFEVEICCYNSRFDAYSSIAHLISDEVGYIPLCEIEGVNYGGLHGYSCRYHNNTTINEEYAFDIINGEQYDRMNIFITSKKCGKNCNEIFKQKIIQEILKSIKLKK